MVATNFPDGVTNAAPSTAMQTLTIPDPSNPHVLFTDFDNFTAAQWVITTTGSGTTAVGNADGGVLVVTNSAANNDAKFLQWSNGVSTVAETFSFAGNKAVWFKSRFKVSDATNSAAVMGLQITDTTPLAVSDGVFFLCSSGSTTLNFVTSSASATTTTAVGTLADDTYVEVAFHYTGQSSVFVYVNNVRVATVATTNVPPTQTLAVSFGVQNGAAAAKSMSVDYILAAKAR